MTDAGTTVMHAPYESASLRQVTGLCIRPGGTELTDRALSFCCFPPGSRLLDVGCGSGATVEHLRSRIGLDAIGVDISRRLISEGLVRNPDLPLAEGRAEDLPLADGELSGILCECVLSLVAAPRVALREFERVLRPGGYLILSDLYLRSPAEGAIQPGLPEDAPLHGAMMRDTLKALLDACGFTLCFWEDHTRLLQELAARLVLAHGSLDGSWCAPAMVGCPGERPGYYLLVARKER